VADDGDALMYKRLDDVRSGDDDPRRTRRR
jgi:hypothetical protein